jgi:hypothetical protein
MVLNCRGVHVYNFISEEYKVYYSGKDTERMNVVAIIVDKELAKAVQEYKLFKDRIIYIRIKAVPENVSNTQGFPQPPRQAKRKLKSYEQLQEITSETPRNDVSFIIGDFNTEIGMSFVKDIFLISYIGSFN